MRTSKVLQQLCGVLSPQGTLERGFAIVRSKAGEIVRTVSSVPAGTKVKIRFADGETSAEISAD